MSVRMTRPIFRAILSEHCCVEIGNTALPQEQIEHFESWLDEVATQLGYEGWIDADRRIPLGLKEEQGQELNENGDPIDHFTKEPLPDLLPDTECRACAMDDMFHVAHRTHESGLPCKNDGCECVEYVVKDKEPSLAA